VLAVTPTITVFIRV